MGTGSGAIAIGIRRIWGSYDTDLSPIAVLVATLMCLYGLQDVIEVRQGSWFEPLKDVEGQLVGIVSNPPYIPSDKLKLVDMNQDSH